MILAGWLETRLDSPARNPSSSQFSITDRKDDQTSLKEYIYVYACRSRCKSPNLLEADEAGLGKPVNRRLAIDKAAVLQETDDGSDTGAVVVPLCSPLRTSNPSFMLDSRAGASA